MQEEYMDQLKNTMLAMIQERYPLEPTFVPEDLREIRLPLGFMTLQLDNWRAPRVRKVNVMCSKVKLPRLEILALEIYPESCYDIPLLAIDFSCMKKKSFIYMNFIPLFRDSAYMQRYVERLRPVVSGYAIGPPAKPKEWMQPYLSESSIYAMADNGLLDKAFACALDVLRCYLDLLDEAVPVADPDYARRVAAASLHYCDQLTEKDGSRKMLGRFIGMDRANRIFREVIR
jgi:15,16-dihydrobiliverdin:ferredoxin oxidoreductase